MNGLALVKAVELTSKATDKNGSYPMLLNIIAGEAPSFRTIAGTLAQREEIYAGFTYLVSYTEGEVDPVHGRQFNWSNLGEVTSKLDVVKTSKELGTAKVIDVAKKSGVIEQSPENNVPAIQEPATQGAE